MLKSVLQTYMTINIEFQRVLNFLSPETSSPHIVPALALTTVVSSVLIIKFGITADSCDFHHQCQTPTVQFEIITKLNSFLYGVMINSRCLLDALQNKVGKAEVQLSLL